MLHTNNIFLIIIRTYFAHVLFLLYDIVGSNPVMPVIRKHYSNNTTDEEITCLPY